MQLGDWQLDTVSGGTLRLDGGAMFGVVPKPLWERLQPADEQNRIRASTNCVLARDGRQTILIDTGYGGKLTDSQRERFAAEPGEPLLASLARLGLSPEDIDTVVLSHLHFDHAGGLLRADGTRAFPHATIVAQKAEWEIALDDNPRILASYAQPELVLVRDWGAQGWVDGEREILPGVTVVPTGGHSAGHQAVIVRGSGQGARTLAFFGDLFMRPWAANPRWVTSFDDFPLDSVARKVELFAQAADEGWIIVLSHESRHPVGRLVRDRDRFRYEAG